MGTGQLPGQEDEKIEALDTAMERYVEVRDNRMALTKQESAARAELEKLMGENKKEIYRHSEGGMVAKIEEPEEKPHVKVSKVKVEGGEPED